MMLLAGAIEKGFTQALPPIDEVTRGLARQEGLVGVYWNDDDAKVLIEIDENDRSFLYHTALAGGLGSNDVGLDRGLRLDELGSC